MRSRSATVDELLDGLAASLRARVLELRRAEEARASFVFREGSEPGWGAGEPAPTEWAAHFARSLHAACEPTALDLLVGLRHEARTLDEIALTIGPRGDRLAAGAWIGDLAAAGLVSRDLETDRVTTAPLGEAIVDLLEATAAKAAEPDGTPWSAPGLGGGTER